MRVLVLLLATAVVYPAPAPAMTAGALQPASCTAKAKRIKNSRRRAAALKKCRRPMTCAAKAERIRNASKRAAALRACRRPEPPPAGSTSPASPSQAPAAHEPGATTSPPTPGEPAPTPTPAPTPAEPAPTPTPAPTPAEPAPTPTPAPTATPTPTPSAPEPAPRAEGGVDDATVVAVLDFGLNPYHWDLQAAKLPQHRDDVRGNDIPLDRPATEWLPGFSQGGFGTFQAIPLALDSTDPNAGFGPAAPLRGVRTSTAGTRHGYWFPRTKVIGAMHFGYAATGDFWAGESGHGVGATSAAVGNIHGTCPECLLFFIDLTDTLYVEEALAWAHAQPWIDVVSNSYAASTPPRTHRWPGDIEGQRKAAQRGQEIVFSAANGYDGAFLAPNATTFSSLTGPDWVLTVGAAAPGDDNHYDRDADGGAYFGAGKPVDVAGIGYDYPTAYGATTVSGTGRTGFSGTSNAAPQLAGIYARSLHLARTALGGPSKVQAGGVIATGAPVRCGAARADCELGDGTLTEKELRTRLLHGAVNSAGGTAFVGAAGQHPTAPRIGEEELMGEGHGTYFGRQAGPGSSAWLTEIERVFGPMTGASAALERPAGEHEWFVVDSYCRQRNWAAWPGGYYVGGVTGLPGTDPDWPIRSTHEQTCLGGSTQTGAG